MAIWVLLTAVTCCLPARRITGSIWKNKWKASTPDEEYTILFSGNTKNVNAEQGVQDNSIQTSSDDAQIQTYKQLTLEGDAKYYEAYYHSRLGEETDRLLAKAEAESSDYCFPNKIEDIAVLRFAVSQGYMAKAGYYLGNLFYDKLQWEEALALWEASVKADDTFPTVFRNLSLVYYNKCKEPQKARPCFPGIRPIVC